MFFGGLNGDDFYDMEYEDSGHNYYEERMGCAYESPISLDEFNMKVIHQTTKAILFEHKDEMNAFCFWFPKCGLCAPHYTYAKSYLWYSKFLKTYYLYNMFSKTCNANSRFIDSIQISVVEGTRTYQDVILRFDHVRIHIEFRFPVIGLRRTRDNIVKFKDQYWLNVAIRHIVTDILEK